MNEAVKGDLLKFLKFTKVDGRVPKSQDVERSNVSEKNLRKYLLVVDDIGQVIKPAAKLT